MASMTAPRATLDLNNLLPSGKHRESFSYLHQNIESSVQISQEAQFFYNMPVLKNLQATNLIPVLDFEKISNDPTTVLEINYLVANVKGCLCTLSTEATSSQLFLVPNSNEEIMFKKYPSSNQIEIRKIRKFLAEGDHSGAAIGSMKPKGDVHFSPQESPNGSIEESLNNIEFDEIRSQTLRKNGWNLMLIQAETGLVKVPLKQAENRRATQIVNLSKPLIIEV
jgi:hypothetical protein